MRSDFYGPHFAASGAMRAATGAGIHAATPYDADVLPRKTLCAFAEGDCVKFCAAYDARFRLHIALHGTVGLRFKQAKLFFVKRQVKVDGC